MFTISYRGFYIHGYCDRAAVRIQSADFSVYDQPFRTMTAAKRWIRHQHRAQS